ncbi:MAG TPA: dihydrolipoamide acetyltransferase family protein [Bryobacteraceae bacterium]|nr:dihydrolipoamide acetyltransferase family protein [Bryobacteraceae bacterium]
MATAVEVPKLGNTVEECLISGWRKRKGDQVSAGEIVADIETDKATFEVSAPIGGTILATFFDEGSLVPVFTNLFVIGEPGENIDSFRPGASEPSTRESVPETKAPLPLPTPTSRTSSRAYSPRARRFAQEQDFHPEAIIGTGPGGRILEEDLRAAYYASSRIPEAAEKQIDDSPVATPITGIREKIARRMRDSLASTAQYTMTASADAGPMLILRARVKASKNVPDININDMVAFCTVKALQQIPDLNSEFIDNKLIKHWQIHLGFATDTPRGLIVPVVRDAHTMTVGELAVRMKDLAARAALGSISADDLSGATFTISNLGGLGIESFTPLLNPPQVAILGIGATHVKPVRKQGKLEFIDAIGLSLTCDHQVIDGAPGARFLQVVKDRIENVESLCTI